MKFTHIRTLTVVLTLPFVLISCNEKKEEDGSSKSSPSGEATARTHVEIGRDVTAVIDSIMISMASITDVDSAKAVAADMKPHRENLQDLWSEAKSMDPPTIEEKETIQKMRDDNDARGQVMQQKFMETLQTSPNAEEIMTVIQTMMQDKEMEEAKNGLQEIYDLEE